MLSAPGTAYFISDQAVTDLDWNKSAKDTVSAKYYYQHDPSIAPYAYSNVAGFTQHLDAGSQVASLTNTQSLRPNLSVAEVFGILREKVYSTIAQPFSPQSFRSLKRGPRRSTHSAHRSFPGITHCGPLGLVSSANAGGIVQSAVSDHRSRRGVPGRFYRSLSEPHDAVGKRHLEPWQAHVTFGGSYSYTQLNTRDERTNHGHDFSADFSQFLQGFVTYQR